MNITDAYKTAGAMAVARGRAYVLMLASGTFAVFGGATENEALARSRNAGHERAIVWDLVTA